MSTDKNCSMCKECLPITEFHRRKNHFVARCKRCTMKNIGSQARWTDAGNEVIRAIYPEGGAHACQVALPTRSIASINQQASRLGVRYEFTGRDGEQKYLAGKVPKGTPLPFQDTAAAHRAWQRTAMPVYVTGNLTATIRRAA